MKNILKWSGAIVLFVFIVGSACAGFTGGGNSTPTPFQPSGPTWTPTVTSTATVVPTVTESPVAPQVEVSPTPRPLTEDSIVDALNEELNGIQYPNWNPDFSAKYMAGYQWLIKSYQEVGDNTPDQYGDEDQMNAIEAMLERAFPQCNWIMTTAVWNMTYNPPVVEPTNPTIFPEKIAGYWGTCVPKVEGGS